MTTDESINKKKFAKKYERKLQMAKQRAIKKATRLPEEKGSDKKKSDYE